MPSVFLESAPAMPPAVKLIVPPAGEIVPSCSTLLPEGRVTAVGAVSRVEPTTSVVEPPLRATVPPAKVSRGAADFARIAHAIVQQERPAIDGHRSTVERTLDVQNTGIHGRRSRVGIAPARVSVPPPVLTIPPEPAMTPEKVWLLLSPPTVSVNASVLTLPPPLSEPTAWSPTPRSSVAPCATVAIAVGDSEFGVSSTSVPALTVVGPL